MLKIKTSDNSTNGLYKEWPLCKSLFKTILRDCVNRINFHTIRRWSDRKSYFHIDIFKKKINSLLSQEHTYSYECILMFFVSFFFYIFAAISSPGNRFHIRCSTRWTVTNQNATREKVSMPLPIYARHFWFVILFNDRRDI